MIDFLISLTKIKVTYMTSAVCEILLLSKFEKPYKLPSKFTFSDIRKYTLF